ncbi:MAG: flagellar export protein FliJ [Candidatus Latescibacteria bacterium]|jgi:flagellar protein FliJ|nr:flagellar export protein FliJ [Candidatus Latescibacterota bacterium]
MNRFRFRFASVLRYREILEDERKRDFGIALDHLSHEEDKLEKIGGDISLHEKKMEKSRLGKVSIHDLQNKFIYARHLDGEKDAQEKQIVKSKGVLESKREELVESMKKKKIFERLKERDIDKYNEETKREEMTQNDEFASQRFNECS